MALAILSCDLQVNLTNPPPIVTITETPPSPATITETASLTQSIPVSPSGLTLDLLNNATYFAPAFGRTVTLVNGSYSINTLTEVYNVQILNHAFGDMNGDGINDAAIVLLENGGGTGQFESVIAIYDSDGTPFQAGTSLLGDRVQVNSIELSSGVITLNMLVQGPNDPMCCPSLAENQSYTMIGSTLWLKRVSTTISGAERSINVETPANWADVTNPFSVSGSVSISPFENTLAYRIFLPDSTNVNESSLMVTSDGMGMPGTFTKTFDLSMAGITGNVIIQFLDLSAADGSTLALGSVVVNVH
jgi:hypothetical protein